LELVVAGESDDYLTIAPLEADHQVSRPEPTGQRTIPPPLGVSPRSRKGL